MILDTFRNLYIAELLELYSAELQLVAALSEMAEAVEHDELKKALEYHWKETQEQVRRLEAIFEELEIRPRDEKCAVMEALLKEVRQIIGTYGDQDVKDVALIGCAQKIEHYEIASYGTARAFAMHLGLDRHAEWLGRTLGEEGAADHKLTRLAEGGFFRHGMNKEAAEH